jgi:hypothetical protein
MIIDEDGDTVPNRRQPLSAPDEARLKQFWYYTRYVYMTQRTPDFDTGDGVPELEDLAKLNVFRKNFPLAKDVDKPPQWPGIEKARRWFEQFEKWASKSIEPSGVPLLYVIREDSDVDEDADEGWYQPNFHDDLAVRGPHGNDLNMFWEADNSTVWDMLVHCLHPTKDYASIKSFERTLDGHAAYYALKNRMMGASMVQTLEAQANQVLQTLKYQGQNRGFTFDKFVSSFEQAFLDCGIVYAEHQKVRMLLKAVVDQSLNSTKHAIRSSIRMKNNFSEAVAYFMEELAERGDTTKQTRSVSAVGTSSGGRGGGRKNNRRGRGGRGGSGRGGGRGSGGRSGGQGRALTKWDPSKPGAYYSYKAFKNFTPDQRAKNKAAREAAGLSSNQTTTNTQLAALTSQVAALTSQLETAQAVNEHQAIGAVVSRKRKADS